MTKYYNLYFYVYKIRKTDSKASSAQTVGFGDNVKNLIFIFYNYLRYITVLTRYFD